VEKPSGLLTAEERARITDIQDLLIGLFVEHKEAVENGGNGLARTLEAEINDLLGRKRNREIGCCRFGLSRVRRNGHARRSGM
jgi:hypothetical protein